MRVPEGDLHCQCKLSIFSLSSFGPCIVFWILQKGTCIGKCIFSIFPAVTHQLKCKQTCIEKCRPRHKISMKKWLKILQISKNVNLFPYITTNLHWIIHVRKVLCRFCKLFLFTWFCKVYIATFLSTRSIENEDIKEHTAWFTKVVKWKVENTLRLSNLKISLFLTAFPFLLEIG